ncbi:DUF805 domain-containing protein [Cucumibacter marinus]|uniref:DUF805 domain-containing protein n=1 Tax=Cucumibacter marinus TaxID=1121252 RepID=UPI0003F958D2|nr:DUF805 domain-containing protein [Cucumibacter marinus]
MRSIIYWLTSFEGRISRKEFWLASLTLGLLGFVYAIAVYAGVVFVVGSAGIPDAPANMRGIMPLSDIPQALAVLEWSGWIEFIIAAPLLVPHAAIMIKRAQDRDSWGPLIWTALSVTGLVLIAKPLGLHYSYVEIAPGQAMVSVGMVGIALQIISGLIFLVLLIPLGFLRGTDGPNIYGPDPLTGEDIKFAY